MNSLKQFFSWNTRQNAHSETISASNSLPFGNNFSSAKEKVNYFSDKVDKITLINNFKPDRSEIIPQNSKVTIEPRFHMVGENHEYIFMKEDHYPEYFQIDKKTGIYCKIHKQNGVYSNDTEVFDNNFQKISEWKNIIWSVYYGYKHEVATVIVEKWNGKYDMISDFGKRVEEITNPIFEKNFTHKNSEEIFKNQCTLLEFTRNGKKFIDSDNGEYVEGNLINQAIHSKAVQKVRRWFLGRK